MAAIALPYRHNGCPILNEAKGGMPHRQTPPLAHYRPDIHNVVILSEAKDLQFANSRRKGHY